MSSPRKPDSSTAVSGTGAHAGAGAAGVDAHRAMDARSRAGSWPHAGALQSHWRWIAAAVALLLVALLVLRQPLAELLWPRNSAQEALRQADAALAQGHLTDADGSGARELYEAALAMDPDRPEPRQGLAAVAHAALEQARRETAAGNYPQAHGSLDLARALSAPRAEVQQVADVLRAREAEGAGLDQLWASAARAHEQGRLYAEVDAALPLYSRILRLDPEHLQALRGRDDAVAELLQQARAALRSGALAEAAAMIGAAAEFDPGHVDLPDTRARLTEERDATLARAAADLEAGHLQQAAQRYRALLEMDPADEQAAEGLVQAGVAHARRAVRLAADFRFADADAALAMARELAPVDAEVRGLAERVEAARVRQAQLDPAQTPAERQRQVTALLEEAAAAQGRGDLLSPPGESAFDKLRAARSLGPDDPRVLEASGQLLAAATGCFERELRANSLGRANACLDVRVALADDRHALIEARRRLAQRWLAIGDERLGAGNLPGAERALESARAIDPSVPGLAEFAQRLRTASASPSR